MRVGVGVGWVAGLGRVVLLTIGWMVGHVLLRLAGPMGWGGGRGAAGRRGGLGRVRGGGGGGGGGAGVGWRVGKVEGVGWRRRR